MNRSARSLSETTVHLPGATVLEGWEARAFVIALETAFRAAMATNPAFTLLSPFVSVDAILSGCDRAGVTLAVGLSGTWGIGAGGSVGAGIVFAPGHRIGFYGTLSGLVGHIYSLSGSIQIAVFNGGPEVMSGDGYMAGVSIATIGWLDAGALDAPIGAHAVFDANHNPIGFCFEIGLSTGIPIISLIEGYGQATKTTTSLGRRRNSRSFSAPPGTYETVVRAARSNGAPPSADGFIAMILG